MDYLVLFQGVMGHDPVSNAVRLHLFAQASKEIEESPHDSDCEK
jgi:hypothetical protein